MTRLKISNAINSRSNVSCIRTIIRICARTRRRYLTLLSGLAIWRAAHMKIISQMRDINVANLRYVDYRCNCQGLVGVLFIVFVERVTFYEIYIWRDLTRSNVTKITRRIVSQRKKVLLIYFDFCLCLFNDLLETTLSHER